MQRQIRIGILEKIDVRPKCDGTGNSRTGSGAEVGHDRIESNETSYQPITDDLVRHHRALVESLKDLENQW